MVVRGAGLGPDVLPDAEAQANRPSRDGLAVHCPTSAPTGQLVPVEAPGKLRSPRVRGVAAWLAAFGRSPVALRSADGTQGELDHLGGRHSLAPARLPAQREHALSMKTARVSSSPRSGAKAQGPAKSSSSRTASQLPSRGRNTDSACAIFTSDETRTRRRPLSIFATPPSDRPASVPGSLQVMRTSPGRREVRLVTSTARSRSRTSARAHSAGAGRNGHPASQ